MFFFLLHYNFVHNEKKIYIVGYYIKVQILFTQFSE